MKFGIDLRHKKTGADIFVLAFQIVSLLPAVYIFWTAGYTSFLGSRNILTILFDFGICALPKGETLLLSLSYRLFSSELAPFFIVLFIALAFGVAANRFIRGSKKVSTVLHYVFSALIIVDIIIACLPLGTNTEFSIPVRLSAIAFKVICLVLLVLDIVFDRRNSNTNIDK